MTTVEDRLARLEKSSRRYRLATVSLFWAGLLAVSLFGACGDSGTNSNENAPYGIWGNARNTLIVNEDKTYTWTTTNNFGVSSVTTAKVIEIGAFTLSGSNITFSTGSTGASRKYRFSVNPNVGDRGELVLAPATGGDSISLYKDY